MSLAREETKTITMWRAADGLPYSNQRTAELNSVAHITGFVHDLEELDVFLKQLVTHYDLRQWLLAQLPTQPVPKPNYDSPTEYDLPSKLVQYIGKGNPTFSRDEAAREMGVQLELAGYRLIKY